MKCLIIPFPMPKDLEKRVIEAWKEKLEFLNQPERLSEKNHIVDRNEMISDSLNSTVT